MTPSHHIPVGTINDGSTIIIDDSDGDTPIGMYVRDSTSGSYVYLTHEQTIELTRALLQRISPSST